ncbi:hypothetical protein H7J87_15265 [Mycolicibacterium wolinskyi]|nr:MULTISPECIES: hypothetical protein [Mycolicibacterium]MCV7286686.1 hypothetical protein [Mycolicibacterium wolinskyi]MCV7293666.1 hypothetical protein [Mycolicibacterium goodii]
MATALDEWHRVIPGRLPLTEALFRSRSAGVHLARLHRSGRRGAGGAAIVLVYALHSETGDGTDDPYTCWYGYPNSPTLSNDRIDLSKLPVGVQDFYTQLHGHFHLGGSGSTGIIPCHEIFTLDGAPEKWEFVHSASAKPKPSNMIPVLLDNSGSACIELTDNTNDDDIDGWILYDSTLVHGGPMWAVIDDRIVKKTDL